MAKDVPDQSTLSTDQNFEIDIDQLYKDWISPIDAIRSNIVVKPSSKMKDLLGKDKNVTGFLTSINAEPTVQESRCHAFYRWIGFPVVSSDNKIYNPGFDMISSIHKNIEDKLIIAEKPIKGFNELSDERERFIQDNLQIFSLPRSITASVAALSSGGTENLRKFKSPFETYVDFNKKTEFIIKDQQYNVDTKTSKVGDRDVSLDKYKDAGGNSPDMKKNISSRTHIIVPFIVDPRIDFSVMPQSKLIAVPFVLDNSYLKISSTSSVRRPLIEKIIRDRQPLKDSANAVGTSVNRIQDYINKSNDVTQKELVKIQKTENIFKTQNDQNQFIEILYQIEAMVEYLANAKKIIQRAQGFYYWLPEPSNIGPEGGSKVMGVIFPTFLESNDPETSLVTLKDVAILDAFSKSETNNVNIDSADVTGGPSADDYGSPPNPSQSFSPATSSGLGNNNATNKEALSKVRLRVLGQASAELRTVEIIMGEFSGLGLCDIIAITGALKIMPMENLLAFLDDEAYERMKVALPSLKVTPAEFVPSMALFEGLVKDFYNIMDSLYETALKGKK